MRSQRSNRPQPNHSQGSESRSWALRSSQLTHVLGGGQPSACCPSALSAPVACAADLKTPFMGNKVDGASLKEITVDKLAEDYGVSDEDHRKKIYGSLKDVMKKDSYTVPQPAHAAPPARAGTEATHRPFGCSAAQGNTNYYSQMLMWILPFGAIYLWLSLKYEKQIARYMKRYRKWQDQRNPKPPPEPKVKRW